MPEQERRAPRSEHVIDREDDPAPVRRRWTIRCRTDHRSTRLPPNHRRPPSPRASCRFAKAERESDPANLLPSRDVARPSRHRTDRLRPVRVQPIDGSSGNRLTDGIGETEGDEDEREVRVGPSILGLQVGTEDAQRLTIDVVDDRREKEQAPDVPAQVSDRPGHMFTGNSSENSRAYP